MSTQTINPAETTIEMIDRMSPDSMLVQHNVTWDEYEELLAAVGKASGLRISYGDGRLQIMTLSFKHEQYVKLIERLVGHLSIVRHLRVLFYGGATMKKEGVQKGVEPDACFYVQSANRVGKKDLIDLTSDPPPDLVVEIDLHHESLSKFPIYATLDVPEIWRYDGVSLTIFQFSEGEYLPCESSQSLPLLTTTVLTDFLRRSPKEDQYDILLAFEEWLKAQP
jgi:Uma2 family endonuclease